MMTEKSPQPPRPQQPKGRLFTPYVILWSSLAGIAVLYLGLLATQPTLVAGLLGADDRAQTAEMEPAAQTLAEVRSLRDTIDLFRNELIEVRAQLSGQTDATRDLTSRIATLETASVAPERVASDESDKAVKNKSAKAQKTAKAKAKEAEKPAKKQAPKIETGSVEQPDISFGPPTVTTTIPVPSPSPSGQFGVQIATGPSVDSLRLSWSLLNERHGASLRALEPRYKTDASGSEPSYDLVVGPVADADAARRLCQELAVKATPCAVSRFIGSAL